MSVVPLLFVREKMRIKKKDNLDTSEIRVIGGKTSSEFLAASSRVFVGRRRSNIAKFALIYGLAGLGVGALVQVLPTWYNLRFGVSESDVGIWMALAQLVSLVGLPLIPRIALGRTVAASVGTGIAGTLFLITMSLSGRFEIAALFFAVRSVLWVISWVVLQSYMVGVVPEAERATVSGIAFAAFVAAMAIGTFAGEALLGAGLLLLPFLVGTVGYLGSSTALLLFFRRLKPPEEVLAIGDAIESSFVEKAA
jgi:MFS family permease